MPGVTRVRSSRVVLIILCVLCLAVSAMAGGYLGYRLIKVRQVENILHVVQKQDIDYRVHLQENPYIEQPYLGMGENYLYSYTDYVELRSYYSFLTNETVSTYCDYQVSATIISSYSKSAGSTNNPEVMRKTYILDQETEEFKSNQARIDRTFDIYLEPYKSELDAFAATVDVSLVGEVHIDITVTLNSPGQYEDTLTRGIAIPLSSEFYTIATHGDAESVKEHTILEKPISIWTTILLSLAVIVGIAGFLAALKKLIDRRSAFLREVNGYLKSYDDIIVNTSSPIVFDNYKIVAIESFKELLTLSNKTNNPIMYWTGDNNAYFYVLTHGLMFLFIVKDKG